MKPWHICSERCKWWGEGKHGADFCNWEHGPALEAETGRPGCSRWTCSICESSWDDLDKENHEECLDIDMSELNLVLVK